MSEKEVQHKIINIVFDLEEKFDEIGKLFRDLGRLLMKLKEAKVE